jgi:hypothetical protein
VQVAVEISRRVVPVPLAGSLHRSAEPLEPVAYRQRAESLRRVELQPEGLSQRVESLQWEEPQPEGCPQRAEVPLPVELVPLPVEVVPLPAVQQLGVRVGLSGQRHPWVGIRGIPLIAAQATH